MPDNQVPGTASARSASVLNLLAGLWLIISPFVLKYHTLHVAAWDTVIVGIIVLVLAWIRAANPVRLVGLSWINLLLGIWLIVSPFALAYANMPKATWNNVVFGVVVIILAIWSAAATPATPQLAGR